MKISSNQFSKQAFNKGSGFVDGLTVSSNSFSRKTFNEVSGSFTQTLLKSSNVAAKKTFTAGENAWGGDNTTETAYGVDDMFGGPYSSYGLTPYGGIDHFKLRTQGTITH